MSALLAALGCALSTQAGGLPDPAAPAGTVAPASRQPTTDQLIVKFRKGSAGELADDAQALATLHAVAQRHGVSLRVLRRNALKAIVAKLDRHLPEDTVEAMSREIAQSDVSVQYAEPDRIKRILATPNDTRYSEQWNLYESTAGMNLPTAWDLSTGSGVVVAVIDTGYRAHTDLAANIVGGYDFISDSAVANDGGGRDSSALDPGDWTVADECGSGWEASDSSWHGTHVAGSIAAVTNNSKGIAGVAYGAKVLPVRVLGKCGGYDSDIADAIIWASGGTVSGVSTNANPARVINMSLGGTSSCGSTTQAAITSARSRNTVVLVAAGNETANVSTSSPANCTGVIPVASVGRSGARAYYSNYGNLVMVAGPGGDMSSAESGGILSTLNAGTTSPGADSYAFYQGTSMATPNVAGVAALMLAKNSALTPDQVLARLRSTTKAFAGSCSGCGSGEVDAYAAVVAASATAVTETESNGTIATAQTVSATNASVSGTMGSTSDIDYFKVSIAAGKTLTASMAPSLATRDFDLAVVNSSGTSLGSSTKGAGLTDKVTYKNTGSSALTVYVKLNYYGGGTGSYTLALSQ